MVETKNRRGLRRFGGKCISLSPLFIISHRYYRLYNKLLLLSSSIA